MQMLVLKATIFPDRETVERALSHLPLGWTRSVVDVSHSQGDEPDWEAILDQVLAADRAIVV